MSSKQYKLKDKKPDNEGIGVYFDIEEHCFDDDNKYMGHSMFIGVCIVSMDDSYGKTILKTADFEKSNQTFKLLSEWDINIYGETKWSYLTEDEVTMRKLIDL